MRHPTGNDDIGAVLFDSCRCIQLLYVFPIRDRWLADLRIVGTEFRVLLLRVDDVFFHDKPVRAAPCSINNSP